DTEGNDLPPRALPPPREERAANNYSPFVSCAEFAFAEFLYVQEEMSAKSVDHLAQLLAALYKGTDPPFANHKDLYATIDAIQQGDIPWESFSVKYTGPLTEMGLIPVWMTETFEVWFRSPLGIFEKQLANPDFNDEMDWAPKRIFKNGKRQFIDLFSRNGVWEQAINSTRQYTKSKEFRKFRQQLFHSSIARILQPLKPHLTKPHITRCLCPAHDLDRDSPRRCAEHTNTLLEGCTLKELWDDFGIVGDIIPFTADFPRADIHELISIDLLHQIIKGTFKDHIVDWVEEYIRAINDNAEAERILADIDRCTRSIAIPPLFPGLRHFPVG
ncbi:hypothetical protein K438DRAFT_2101088, partial [Mycena galopus ATCC 62051]